MGCARHHAHCSNQYLISEGEVMVYSHVPVAIKHVHGYVHHTSRDVCVPNEVWSALQSEGGIVNSNMEQFRVTREGRHLLPSSDGMVKIHVPWRSCAGLRNLFTCRTVRSHLRIPYTRTVEYPLDRIRSVSGSPRLGLDSDTVILLL